MTVTAVILLLLSVVVHAGWNTISRRHRPATAFMLLASATGTVLLAPVALWHAPGLREVAPTFWVALGGTSLFMAMYYIALAGAYRVGEMSLVYPLARALPALLVPLVS
ncbi:MAG TPA: drug/metabolite transporter, partial [Phycisphaerae bacterium]|nr:drug/metabolite transporter [Phycisphaerae bacterium]